MKHEEISEISLKEKYLKSGIGSMKEVRFEQQPKKGQVIYHKTRNLIEEDDIKKIEKQETKKRIFRKAVDADC